MNRKTIFLIAGIACIGFIIINLATKPNNEKAPTRPTASLSASTPANSVNTAALSAKLTPSNAAKAVIDSQASAKTTTSQQIPPITTPEITTPEYTTPEYLPVIAKSPTRAAQYQGELSDHQAYNKFHQQQQTQLEQRFVVAADEKIAHLENLLEKGRQQGLSQQQLQVAIDKITALKRMQATLIKQP
ncbi:hypothetical protein [Pseudoalteromonas sp.]|uniref:hypothetical protein n=1 Tax=Pseudoalteromonas sp. TaxID=53249 RepID=UPI0030017EC4